LIFRQCGYWTGSSRHALFSLFTTLIPYDLSIAESKTDSPVRAVMEISRRERNEILGKSGILITKLIQHKNQWEKESIISVFLMRLLDRQDLLDNHQFLIFIDLVKRGVTAGDVKPVDNNPAA